MSTPQRKSLFQLGKQLFLPAECEDEWVIQPRADSICSAQTLSPASALPAKRILRKKGHLRS